ncbi:MAG: DUF1080 domain-containing protein [Planctomycetota bacterium]
MLRRMVRQAVHVSFLLAAALLVLLPACDKEKEAAEKADAKPPAAAASAGKAGGPEWKSLFDGKTFANWKETDFGGKAKPRIENGTIILPAGNMMTGITYTGSDYLKMNYEIELEAQRVEGGDFFCGLTFPVGDSAASLILGGWGGTLCGISCLDGGDAANNETTKMITFEDKRWYKVQLRVEESRIAAWLDDEKLVDAKTKGRKIDVRIEMESSKPLGIATYSTTGAIRNLRMRKLQADELTKEQE